MGIATAGVSTCTVLVAAQKAGLFSINVKLPKDVVVSPYFYSI
jgi:hypothetical protein